MVYSILVGFNVFCVDRTQFLKRYDTVSEWLRRWTRNPLGSARAGSNPAGVGFSVQAPVAVCSRWYRSNYYRIIGLVVEYIVAIDVTRVRFPDDAIFACEY